MALLGPNGKPIASKRRVLLKIEVIDTAPLASDSTRHALGYELDSNDPVAVERFLATIPRTLKAKLVEIGFIGAPVAGVSTGLAMLKEGS
jgi:hypothetical protein